MTLPLSPPPPSSQSHLILTGGSSGIGHAVARAFQADGYVVHNLSRRPSGVEGVHDIAIDLADLNAVETAANTLCAALQQTKPRRICIVHNAGIMLSDRLQTITQEKLQYANNLNVLSPTLLTARLLPALQACTDGASIIYVGSTLSEKAVAGRLSYVITKHAMVGLMRATCQDLFGSSIHTACVCPGFTDTEMLQAALRSYPEAHDAIINMVSFRRLITPDEIARVVHFVEHNPAMNGAVVHANLGQLEK